MGATSELPRTAGHPFYERLNGLFSEHGFDDFVEGQCDKFYADKMGRPSLAPGVCFRLLRQRGERLERPCAHLYGSGGMRRLHVRGHENVLKRLLIQVSAFNLGMLMRQSLGVGTPRGLQGRICALMLLIFSRSKHFRGLFRPIPATRPEKSNLVTPSLLPQVRTA